MLTKPNDYSKKGLEKICCYASENFKNQNWTSLDMEVQGVINTINNFRLYLNKKFTLRTDCKNIVKYMNNQNNKRHNSKRWLKFQNAIQGMGYTIKFEHITGKSNILADILSRKFAG